MEKKEKTRQKIKCQFCKNTFVKYYVLHLKLKHENEKSYNCQNCDSVFGNIIAYQSHQKEKHRKRHKCEECPKTYISSYGLKEHYRIEHLEIKDFKCDGCGKAFGRRQDLKKHIKNVHGMETIDALDLGQMKKCEKCEKLFENEVLLSQHTMKDHMKMSEETNLEHKCQFCKKSYHFGKFGMYFAHLRFEHGKESTFKCIICGLVTHSIKGYRSHYNTNHHTNAEHFKCEKCPKTFRRYPQYRSHYNVAHLKIKNYKCNACGKTFGARDTLVKHVKRIHGLESVHAYDLDKIKKCDDCQEVFENESALNQHKNEKHPNLKPYRCDHCEKSFRSLKKLNKHMEKIQKKKDENENMKEPEIIVAVKPKNEVQNETPTNESFKEEFKPKVDFEDPYWWITFN